MIYFDSTKVSDGTWFTIWGIDEKNGFYKARASTSDGNKEDGYENSNWFLNFSKNSSEQASKLKEKDRIIVNKMKVSNVSKKKEDGSYVTYLNVRVDHFSLASGTPSGSTNSSIGGFPKPKPPIKDFEKIEEENSSLPFDL